MADTEEKLESEINQHIEKKQKSEEDQQVSKKAEKVFEDWFYDSDDIDGYGSDDEERESDYKKYNQQLEESGGYFVDSFPKMDPSGAVVPLGTLGTPKISELAINWYNNNNGTNYKVTEVVYGVGQMAQYIYFSITFCAKEESSGEVKTFQAKVCEKFPSFEQEIRYCDIADDNATAVINKFVSKQRLDRKD